MLVGREAERRTIDALLSGARLGGSQVLVLSGEPGIGKTALLEEAEGLAEEMAVLRAQGIDAERFVPFAGLSQLLRPLLPLLDQVPTPQAEALSSALMLGGGDAEAGPTRFAVGAGTLSLLSRAAESRPLAVLVDDGHLLDEASAGALVFAARRLLTDPVAVLVAVRPDAPGSEAWSPLPQLRLRGLDLQATAALLGVPGGVHDGSPTARLHRATGGNPLAILELGGGELPDAVPPDSPVALSEQISRAFLGRADGLAAGERTALLVAATDGASVARVHDACRALGVREAGLAAAEDAGLVAVDGDRLEFRHPLVRSAIYGAASAEQRRAVHRALAGVVAEADTGRLAWHLSESAVAPDEETAGTLERLARHASARGAYAVAATAAGRAAELSSSPDVRAERLVDAAGHAWLAGQAVRALELTDRALAGDAPALLRARAQELRGAVQTRCGSLDDALATLLDAAGAVEDLDPDLAVRLHSDAMHVCFYRADAAAAMRCCAALDRLLDRVAEPGTRTLGEMAAGMALVVSGDGETGVRRVREALRSLVAPGLPLTDLFRHPLRVQGALWLRERGSMRDEVTAAIDRLREQAALGALPHLLMQIGRDAATTDRWDEAEQAYAEAVRLARETGMSTDLAMAQGGLAIVLARRGQADAAVASATEAEELGERNGIRVPRMWAALARGDLAAGDGDAAAAAVRYQEVEAVLEEGGFADPDQSAAPELTEVLVHVGRSPDARRLAERFHGRALRKGQPWASARAERALALCATGADTERAFRRALELHAQTPDVYETARTQLALGAWLRRERRRMDARLPLQEALEVFQGVGAAPWADRAASELQATGQTVRRRDVGPLEQLTPQERQIARLLAEGRTTREAAATLFLSPKTVEYHLRHVYLKLDIRSRSALAEAMGVRRAGS